MRAPITYAQASELLMETAEQHPQRRGIVAALGAMIRHSWWLAALVIVLVAAIALAQFASTPPVYRAQQSFYIVVAPVGASTSYENYQASAWEESIGHALSEHKLTTVIGGFAVAINSRLAANDTIGGPQNLTQSQFEQDLSWNNYQNHVVLTAYWTTPQGATDLLNATIGALIAGDLTHVTTMRGPVPPDLTAQIVTDGAATPPNLDPGHAIAAQQLLLTRISLGVVAGILLMLGWEWLRLALLRRTPRAAIQESAPEVTREETPAQATKTAPNDAGSVTEAAR